MLCVYCNHSANFQLKNGKWCCKKSPNSCPARRQKNSSSQKDKTRSWTTSGEFQIGNIPWNKNKSGYKLKKISLEKVLVENSTYARHSLKRRLIEEKLIKYHCEICDSPPI